jgi:hypothetical protein
MMSAIKTDLNEAGVVNESTAVHVRFVLIPDMLLNCTTLHAIDVARLAVTIRNNGEENEAI